MINVKIGGIQLQYSGKNVAVVGDWHGDTFYAMNMLKTLNYLGVKVVISAGDFGFWSEDAIFLAKMSKFMKRNDMLLLFVDGNHENHTLLNSLPVNENTGMHHIRKNIFHILRGDTFTLSGDDGVEYIWMGLGGAVSVDKYYTTEGVDWFPEEALTSQDLEHALSAGKVNVMVTHDSPVTNTLTNRYMKPSNHHWPIDVIADSNIHQRRLTEVMEALQPEFLYHGHHHYRYNERVGYTDVIGLDCNGSAYMANLMITGVDGSPEMDETRMVTPELVNTAMIH